LTDEQYVARLVQLKAAVAALAAVVGPAHIADDDRLRFEKWVHQLTLMVNKAEDGPKLKRKAVSKPKLLALRQILEDCGMGADGGVVESTTSLAPARHRVLVFAQLKASLDLIAHSLFDVQMPHVSYARLDGTLDASKRVDVVQVWMLRTR
jgi:SNF2 family DNA or RNA helicase